MHILMVAAENGVLPGAKVGGMADVIAQVPPALVGQGLGVDVVIPAYGTYHLRPDAHLHTTVEVPFGGTRHQLSLYRLDDHQGTGQWVLHHPLFGDPPGRIYHHDGAHQPFATDANLYALFCAGIAACIERQCWPALDVLHLHDWHAAGVLLFVPPATGLRTVFTIHNLALQGQRPLAGHPSSLASWFGELACPADAVDPRYPDCYNPMRLGINHADRVHAVSPGYAREIIAGSPATGGGGEGLEQDLQAAAAAGRLHGILNGCEYPPDRPRHRSRPDLWSLIERCLARWIAARDTVAPADFLALRNLARMRKLKRRPMLVTNVGRLVPQKIGLLRSPDTAGAESALEQMLERSDNRAVIVMLGTGDPECERFLIEVAARFPALVYLRGYDDELADALYDNGDLFLMPSVFEPCGISQMLAMRAGQPCLVHATGGLRDTVRDGIDGFHFDGGDPASAAQALVERWDEVVHLWQVNPDAWKRLRFAASSQRFNWADSAADYVSRLYAGPAG